MSSEVLLVRIADTGEGAIEELRVRAGARRVQLFRALEQPLWYAYVATDVAPSSALREALTAELSATVDRLTPIMCMPGASAGAPAPYHYVVETDVLEAFDADLNDWYDREHLPGLAAVPGTVHASRYRNLDGGPRYHACYELATLDAFGSAPWLAVRATPRSARVRPAFRNTRRTMFRRVDAS